MFETSLVESRGLVASGSRRWTTLGSLAVQCALAGLLIAIPMLRPDILPPMTVAPRLTVPFLSRPPVEPVRVETSAAESTGVSLPATSAAAAGSGVSILPHPGMPTVGDAPSMVDLGMPGGTGLPGVLTAGGGDVQAPTVSRARVVGPVNVSKGVLQGMLLTPIQPVYPPIARAAGIAGPVVLEAVISKAGRIESLHVVSGPQMLRGAAMSAVQTARYAPYKLNGEAVDVETTITVVFQLGS